MVEDKHEPKLDLVFTFDDEENAEEKETEWVELRAGDLCPKCKTERLDYDGLLNLVCPKCGGVFGSGCFT